MYRRARTQLSLGLLGSIIYYMVLAGYDPYISRSDDFLGKVAAGQIVLTYFAAAQIQMRANADNNEAGDPKNIYDNVVFNIACVRRAHIVSPIAAPAADSAGAAGEAY